MRRLLSIVLVIGLLGCQKPIDSILIPPVLPPEEQGAVYEHGTPTGQLVQKVIGAEGGTLASADGSLKMTIPAGAVSQATTFSVQPVTPTLPGLVGRQSYRLRPEGMNFTKPVTIQLQYGETDLANTSAQLLFMAYQSNDGIWRALPGTELDETARTLTVTTTHFSDWGAFAEFELVPANYSVKPGGSTLLALQGYADFAGSLANAEVQLTQQAVLDDPTNIKNWRVIGRGSVRADASQVKATYSAPVDATGGKALVAVDIYNFLPPKFQPRKGATGKATVLTSISIEGNSFQATLDGVTYDCEGTATVDERGTTISANITSPNGTLRPFWYHMSEQKLKAGTTYPLAGMENVLFTEGASGQGQIAWVPYYTTCEGEIFLSPGEVHIDTVEGDVVSGTLNVKLHHVDDNCHLRTRTISAKFRLRLVEDR
ncbi:hypothetical protein ACAW74_18340 [Fibrella sp. WM1]|uniref:hypothetical protein n=1 Tax=Fibrella musci TaxID=3242485 RepID=UPI00351FB3FC